VVNRARAVRKSCPVFFVCVSKKCRKLQLVFKQLRIKGSRKVNTHHKGQFARAALFFLFEVREIGIFETLF